MDKSLIKPMDNIYLGPEFSPNEIDSAIREYELQRKYKIVKDTDNESIADKLISNKVIARFSGRMEFGQRALRNRSILANPKNARMM